MTPHVLIVTGEYPPIFGGVGDYTVLLSAHLEQLGVDVVVLTARTGAERQLGVQRGQSPSSIDLGCPQNYQRPTDTHLVEISGDWGLSSWQQVTTAAIKIRPDIVHIQYQAAAFGMHPAVNLLPLYLRLRFGRVLVVTTFHDLRVPYIFPKAGPLRHAAVRALDFFSHASVATNQADLIKLGGTGVSAARRPKRWLIPLSTNIHCSPPPNYTREAWRKQLGLRADVLLLSYFGFMNDSKGVDLILQALDLLVKKGVDAELLVVGGETGTTDPTNRAYSRTIAAMIDSLQLTNKVHWTGFLSPPDVSAALLSSDICVLPFRDGASMRRGSLLAAIEHGLPTVTTHPEYPEPLLIDGQNIAFVERNNPAALAESIERLWRDPASRLRLSAGARSLASRFQWPDIARHHLKMYNCLLSS